MHKCTGGELGLPPGEHNQPANSWLEIDPEDVPRELRTLAAGNIYECYKESSGVLGLIDFNTWESTDKVRITDKVRTAAGVGKVIIGDPDGVLTISSWEQSMYPAIRWLRELEMGLNRGEAYHMNTVKGTTFIRTRRSSPAVATKGGLPSV